uniref:Uncharacterized protein n=1 Tax=Anguilla anguilla TaxID=7936 RepID=A0A0E9RM64_ANGAN
MFEIHILNKADSLHMYTYSIKLLKIQAMEDTTANNVPDPKYYLQTPQVATI